LKTCRNKTVFFTSDECEIVTAVAGIADSAFYIAFVLWTSWKVRVRTHYSWS